MSVRSSLVRAMEHAPYIVTRHPAARRARMLDAVGVDLVLDVGAAHGSYGGTLRSFGYAGRIESFEPMAEPFAQLSVAAGQDPLWSVHHFALGEEDTRAEINVAGDSSSLLPMLDAHRAAAPEIAYTGTETVEVRRLDNLNKDLIRGACAPFLKVDTQGFERQVLAGARETLPDVVGLQLELSFVPLYEGSMLVDEAVGWAYDSGFVLVGIERGFIAPSGAALQADGVFLRPGLLA